MYLNSEHSVGQINIQMNTDCAVHLNLKVMKSLEMFCGIIIRLCEERNLKG